MKICYLINQYPKVSHSFIRREILELERQGAEVFRIALRGWDHVVDDPEDVLERERTRYVLKNGLASMAGRACQLLALHPLRFFAALGQTIALARTSDRPLFKHIVSLAEACVVAAWVTAHRSQHIHAHFGTNAAEVAMLASLLASVPFSFTVHGPEEFDHPMGLCLKRKVHHAALVVAISSFTRSQLYRWAAVPDWSKISVVRCGLDERSFSADTDCPTPSTTFVCVGRLCEQKGQLLLLEALRLVLERGYSCRLVLAGDGEMRPEIERVARDSGVTNSVVITGWISGDQVKRELSNSRALLLPSFAEGLPVVLMEALAQSRPVITTAVAGIPELIKQGESGWIVPAGDVEALATAMVDCLESDAARLAEMGRRGRQRVLAGHSIRVEVEKLLSMFAKVAQRR